jgi:hypothetical protein
MPRRAANPFPRSPDLANEFANDRPGQGWTSRERLAASTAREQVTSTLADNAGHPKSCYGSEGHVCSVVGQGHKDIDFVPAPIMLNYRASIVPAAGRLQPFNGRSNALVESWRLAPQPGPKVPATGNGARRKPQLGGLIGFASLNADAVAGCLCLNGAKEAAALEITDGGFQALPTLGDARRRIGYFQEHHRKRLAANAT